MKLGVALSSTAHAAVLAWGLLSFTAPAPLEVADVEALPIDIVPIEEFTQSVQGDKKADLSETPAPKPTQRPDVVENAENIGESRTQTIGKNSSVTIGQNSDIAVGKNMDLKVSSNLKETVGQNIEITAGMKILLKVAGSSIEISPKGIEMKGPMITIQANAMLEAKAPMTQVKGDTLLILKGMMTLIN